MKKHIVRELGIEVTIPEDWDVIPTSWVKNMRMRAAPTSEELAEMLAKAQEPFLYIQKSNPDPSVTIPTVQFSAKPKNTIAAVGGMGNLLKTVCFQLKAAFPDVNFLIMHEKMIVAGLVCGHLKSTMSVLNDQGESFASQSELYVIESSSAVFLLGMSAPADKDHDQSETFNSILRSIKLF